MCMTENFGIYFGTPLIHGRKSMNTYNYIMERMRKKLSGWKSRFLFLAGSHTLVQSVISTMPTYVMQTSLFLISVCNLQIKLREIFQGGDTETTRKMHLMNWQTVCMHKRKGGLGDHIYRGHKQGYGCQIMVKINGKKKSVTFGWKL